MIDLKALDQEIVAGLKNETNRLDNARQNFCYYKGDIEAYRYRLPMNRVDDGRSYRSSLIMNKIVNTLSQNLYKTSPLRTIKKYPVATDFLQKVYKQNAMFAKWGEADRLSIVNQCAAWQVSGGDDQTPIKITLWDAHNFVVWEDDDDPCRAAGVCTIDYYDNKRRYTLWTKDNRLVYETDKIGPGQTTGGTKPRLVADDPNAYGILPFEFVSFNFPTTEFWSGCPGDNLREVNDYVNFRLTDSADALRFMGRPIWWASNIDPSWEPPKPISPGDFLRPATSGTAHDEGKTAEFHQLSPDLGFAGVSNEDITFYLTHTLECAGVPPASIRLVQTQARSGVSIAYEQLPLLLWTKMRQPMFTHYESQLAELVFKVAAAHYRNHGKTPPPEVEESLNDFELSVRWGESYPEVPGPERDREDLFNLQLGLTDQVAIMMKRNGFTEDEAIEALKEIERRKKIFEEITGQPTVLPVPPVIGDGTSGLQSVPNAPDDTDEGEGYEEN